MWAQALNTALGVWLMFAPAALGYGDPAATSDRIVGPLVAAFAFVAIAQITRSLRRVNLLCGPWLVVAPLILSYPMTPAINSVLCGIAITLLARIHGRVTTPFGGGWTVLWRPTQASGVRGQESGVKQARGDRLGR